MSNLRSHKALLTVIVFVSSILAFQNCTKTNFENKDDGLAQKESGGNYDGKVFVLRNPQVPCADGSDIVVQITEHPEAYVLDREKCATVPGGRILASGEVQLDANQPNTIVYQNQTLTEAPPSPAQAQAGISKMTCYSTGTNPSLRVTATYYPSTSDLVGEFNVTDAQSQQSYPSTILIKDEAKDLNANSAIFASDGIRKFEIGQRGPNGIARITFSIPESPANSDEVLCQTY